LRFASLGSGSSGNALLVESGRTRVLLDCGFSVRETEARLSRIGIEAASLTALVVTHEHEDHASGVFALARRHGVPVLASYGTLSALRESDLEVDNGVEVRLVCGEEWAVVGDLEILPYTVPHDAREPVQYLFSDGARRLGVLTDTGHSTAHIHAVLSGCDALVLETNHDRAMLMAGDYPHSLKARIAGRLGHMDNETSAALLGAIDRSRLKHVVAAHLSEKNNTPELARAALAAALGCEIDWVEAATQAAGFGWRDLA
jgi:phosphoribosyl 1,2-cyclic phosphodiesterase